MAVIPGFENRIVEAIEIMRVKQKERIEKGETTREDLDQAGQVLNIDFKEYSVFQDIKSRAQAAGILNYEEATSIYAALGSGPDDFNRQDTETKAVVVALMKELLQLSRAGKI